eukprot:TRINITY_DN421_c0_g1_i1.p1 TRINITY_DN421_c0_g1~~TRINITY_DN421_c0_g1_i1.p1  ORF type:complete len:408 (-),score=101.40 TRINITY_DN421_c0_g1_i1:118-1341(-)
MELKDVDELFDYDFSDVIEPKDVFSPHSNLITSIKFSHEGDIFVTVAYDFMVTIFNSIDLSIKQRLGRQSKKIQDVAFSEDDFYLATCGNNWKIRVYTLNENEYVDYCTLEANCVCYSIEFLPFYTTYGDSAYICVGDQYGYLKVWDVCSQSIMKECKCHSKSIRSLSISFDGSYVCTGSDDLSVRISELSDLEEFFRLKRHNISVNVVKFGRVSRIFSSGGNDRKVRVFDCSTKSHITSFSLDSHVTDINFLNNDSQLIAAVKTGHLILCSVVSCAQLNVVQCTNFLTSSMRLAVSPNNKTLIASFELYRMRAFNLTYSIDFHFKDLLDFAEDHNGGIISTIFERNVEHKQVLCRKLISHGIVLNQADFGWIVDLCWDLSDLNERNGGNMHSFMCDSDDSYDSCDD